MATTRPLFGGAVTCSIPNDWRDVSTIRQVPDNQECWQDAEGRLLVVEILEQQSVDDAGAAAYFFSDLANANGVPSADRSFTAQPELVSIPGIPTDRSSLCFGSGFQRVAMGRDTDPAGHSRQHLQEVRWIQVEVCVVRLPSVHTDLLITLSTPSEPNPQQDSNAAPTDMFRNIVQSLQIHDWRLFGGQS